MLSSIGRARRLAVGILAIGIAALFSGARASSAQLFPGDADGSGRVDPPDVDVVVSVILESGTAAGNADCTANGTVDARDLVCIQDRLLNNEPPSLVPGQDRTVAMGDAVVLADTLATDPDGDLLAWTWNLASRPESSVGFLEGSSTRVPTLLTERPGTYVVEVSVTDGVADSPVAEITITALPRLTTVSSSPADGEGDVAVTRETIVEFSNALNAATAVDSSKIFARFGGANLGANLHVSFDRRRVTLFYTNTLPASARIRVTVDGSQLVDEFGNQVDGDGDGIGGGTALIDFDTLTLTVLPNTAVCGTVYASELAPSDVEAISVNTPLEGVTITVDGMEQTLRAVTDSAGNFCLDPAPVGEFFVHIDGRTATTGVPLGAYYPFVAKKWMSIASQTINIGEIYLPLVVPDTLQPVSPTEDVVIHLPQSVIDEHPEFESVAITVRADSLFGDDGTRGGMVGLAPVPPDRLPSPLPPNALPAMVVTVQSDGALNFDSPSPICFPNLPLPGTGLPVPPGSSSGLWSFNHDAGDWEIVGTLLATEAGDQVCAVENQGVLAPGWHFPAPGVAAQGAPLFDIDSDFARWFGCVTDPGAPGCCGSVAYDPATSCCEIEPMLPLECHGPGWENCSAPLAVIEREEYPLSRLDLCSSRIQRTPLQPDPDQRDCSVPAALILVSRWPGLPAIHHQDDPAGSGITPFLGPCIAHDACYRDECGGSPFSQNGGEVGRKSSCDQNFHDQLIAACAVNQDPQQLAVCLGWANLYFTMVSGFGSGAYHEGQSKACICCPVAEIPGLARQPDELTGKEPPGALPALRRVYFAVYDLERGEYVGRGRSDVNGRTFASISVPAGRLLRVQVVDAVTLRGAGADFLTSGVSGTTMRLPPLFLEHQAGSDSDGDGLADGSEAVIGTSVNSPDTDGDGVSDLAELQEGSDPLDGLPSAIGVIRTVSLPGTALDVSARDNLAAVALGTAGVALLNLQNGVNPTALSFIDTPGSASSVALGRAHVAVADGTSGIAFINIQDPQEAWIERQVGLGSAARAVVIAGELAFVGLGDGRITVVDVLSGAKLGEVWLPKPVQDLGVEGDTLFALTQGTLYSLPLYDDPSILDFVDFPGLVNSANGRMRLFVGGGVAYPVHTKGYHTIDVADPADMSVLALGDTPQFGWKQIVANGSGLGVAAVSGNQAFDGAHHVSLYDISDPALTDQFITTHETPGVARAVSIYNGLAYVADHTAGLQVVNYLPYDALGVPPTISLSSNYPVLEQAEEGQFLRLTATVTDDVQVRNVEFWVDGVLVATDGNFPFEHRFVTPLIAQQPAVVVRARATDTGGNATWTPEIQITLFPDARPPRVTNYSPKTFGYSVPAISVTWSEPIDYETVDSSTWTLTGAGPDGVLGTGDDVQVTSGLIEYGAEERLSIWTFDDALPSGLYRSVLSSAVTDLAGNGLVGGFTWSFRSVNIGLDSDGDGVPDDLEPLLGLDPFDPDTDGDGIPDGDEDFDGDGLANAGEVLAGTDPTDPDSDDDGTSDALEDPDLDSVTNADEHLLGTDPLNPDTDGDGWPDGAERDAGSNPVSPDSTPKLMLVAGPAQVRAVRPTEGNSGGLPGNLTFARPSQVRLTRPTQGDGGGLAENLAMAAPAQVRLARPTEGDGGGLGANLVPAAPAFVRVSRPTEGQGAGPETNVTVAGPADLRVTRPTEGDGAGLGTNLTAAAPSELHVTRSTEGESGSLPANLVPAAPSQVLVTRPTPGDTGALEEGPTIGQPPSIEVTRPPASVQRQSGGAESLGSSDTVGEVSPQRDDEE